MAMSKGAATFLSVQKPSEQTCFSKDAHISVTRPNGQGVELVWGSVGAPQGIQSVHLLYIQTPFDMFRLLDGDDELIQRVAVGPGPLPEPLPGDTSDQTIGLVLAISSSLFIGASFIIKKRGLRLAGSTGIRAGERESLLVTLPDCDDLRSHLRV